MCHAQDEDSRDCHSGIYVRLTGGTAGDQVRLVLEGNVSNARIDVQRWNSTTSYNNYNLQWNDVNGYQWTYLALVVDYGSSIKPYLSKDGVSWVHLNTTITGFALNSVNGGIHIKENKTGMDAASTCDWLVYGT